jgi:hypothetical protein
MNRWMRSVAAAVIAAIIVGLVAPAALAAPTTRRANVKRNGDQAGGAIYPSISGNGRVVAFETFSPLVARDDNAQTDIYVRDMKAKTTELVSVRSNGKLANGDSGYAAISANGRFVSFWSEATNLVRGDTNGVSDIFVHDRTTGRTFRVSVNARERQGNNGCGGSALSNNGRFVMFSSDATNEPRRGGGERGQPVSLHLRRRAVRRVPVGRDEPGVERHQRGYRRVRPRAALLNAERAERRVWTPSRRPGEGYKARFGEPSGGDGR